MFEIKHAKDSSSPPKFLPSFSPASLLSPGDVQGAVAHEPPEFRKKVQGSWYLCGDTSAAMYSLLAGRTCQDLALRVTGIQTPVGARYGIVSHQLRQHVHRFLLPLYEPRIGDFLLAMREGRRLAFQLGYNESEEAALLRGRSAIEREFIPLLSLAGPLPRELTREAIRELPMVIAEMNDPERLPMLGPEPARDVSVSVVLPRQTLAGLMDTA